MSDQNTAQNSPRGESQIDDDGVITPEVPYVGDPIEVALETVQRAPKMPSFKDMVPAATITGQYWKPAENGKAGDYLIAQHMETKMSATGINGPYAQMIFRGVLNGAKTPQVFVLGQAVVTSAIKEFNAPLFTCYRIEYKGTKITGAKHKLQMFDIQVMEEQVDFESVSLK